MPDTAEMAVSASNSATHTSDELLFAEEDSTPPTSTSPAKRKTWRILIVDDDEDVHNVTTFALSSAIILFRPIEFLHAHSAAEAKRILDSETDIAVILLDVVMESEDSGLKLVKTIREERGMTETRIILRTGQPGYAPEIAAISEYDINDYKTKSELTRTKLITAVTAAIRSYNQFRAINAGRRGLELIVRACAQLTALHGLRSFAEGVITQMAGLLGLPPEGLVCAKDGSKDASSEGPVVIAAAGHYSDLMNRPIDQIDDPRIREALRRCLQERHSLYEADGSALFFGDPARHGMAAFIDTPTPLDRCDRQLLDMFCSNISVAWTAAPTAPRRTQALSAK